MNSWKAALFYSSSHLALGVKWRDDTEHMNMLIKRAEEMSGSVTIKRKV